jgi:BirA family transcriptional regulator, biotin operon repressor / biotin---[acetyl-CoA-carboxylase] ligase
MRGVGFDTVRIGRTPLREAVLTRALVRPGTLWSRVRVVAETGSTNADVAEAARRGAAEGLVLVAESQVAGRGRLGRTWQSPPGAGLTMSVLLRPRSVAGTGLGWLPLLTGVAVVEACAAEVGPVEAALKWPNDLLVRPAAGGGWGKCGGILAEVAAPGAVVVGIGINFSQEERELPPPVDPAAHRPTSLSLAGGHGDRERLAAAVLRRLSHWYGRWHRLGGDPGRSGLAAAYRARCRTLGQAVTVSLPGGERLRGTATDIDADGRLVVRTEGGEEHHLAAGDVHHLRDTP